MKFDYIDKKDSRNIINNIFVLAFEEEDLPFKTIIVPTGFPSIAYVFGERQKIIHNKEVTDFNELIVSGQFDSNYDLIVDFVSLNLGINLHPTALYKLLNTNVSLLTNKHICLKDTNPDFFKKASKIFIKNKVDVSSFVKEFLNFIDNLELNIDKDVIQIDLAINYILEKEGMIQVVDLLKVVALSQKSLETKFKKIIGLTPGKYTRLIRFTKLMRKYESKEIDLTDLIYMYNYYDHSHFIKDFKLFMSESPKVYFKKDYPLIKAYSKDL